MNAMVYQVGKTFAIIPRSLSLLSSQHGTPQDFDEWCSKGAAGWDYQTMKRYVQVTQYNNL